MPMNPRLLRPPARFQAPHALWTPASIGSSLKLWLDADDQSTVTQNAGAVSQWADKSGNGGDFTQATAILQPTYSAAAIGGKSAITFDGSDDSLQAVPSAWAYSYPLNAFAVFRARAFTADYNGLFGFYSDPAGFAAGWGVFVKSFGVSAVYSVATDFQPAYDGDGAVTYQTNATHIMAATIGDGLLRTHGNGVLDGEFAGEWAMKTGIASLDNKVSIGNDLRFGRYTDWDVGEAIIVGGGVLPDPDRQRIEGYLAWKWGSQAQLPSNHSYKNAAPTV